MKYIKDIKITIISFVLVIVTASTSIANAATGGIINTTNKRIYNVTSSNDIQALISDLKDGGNDVFLKEDTYGKYYNPSDKAAAQSAEVSRLLKAGSVDFKDPTAIKTYIKNNAATIVAAIKVETDKVPTKTVDTTTYTTPAVTNLTVSSVSTINITKRTGDAYTLPLTVLATLSNGTTKNFYVTWDKIGNTSVAGKFIFTGTLIMVDGVVNTNKIYVTTKLTVEDKTTPAISIGAVPDITSSSFGYNVATEIANSKYKGRLAGTEGYTASANYVSNVFQSLGLTASGDNNTYLQRYGMNIAEYASIPTLNIKGTELTFLKDFKLHGNTGSGIINSNETVFVGNGYEENYLGLSVTGKTVLFLGDILPNKPLGVLDRAVIAKAKGAASVLIIPNMYMPIYTFEKPIKYEGVSFPVFYLSKDASSTYLEINTSSASIGDISSVKVEGNIDLTKTAGADSYNVLGMIKGNDQSKTIVVSASLDGYGSLPDGRTANGASTNAAAVGDLCDLAKYYTTTKPECNILFAAFGSQAELMEGSQYFVNNYSDISNVIANIDVYDIGNPESNTTVFNAIDKNYTALHNAVSKSGEYVFDLPSEVNYPFGNNYQFFKKNIPSMFIRYGDNLDSLNDNNIQIDAMAKVKTNIINIITNLVPKQVVIDPSQPVKEYVASIDETLNVVETKYAKVYYEDSFPQSEVDKLTKDADAIFINTLWWNFNTIVPTEKVKVYCVDGWEEGPLVINRTDKIGTGEKSGGYQSFKDYSLSIVRNSENTQGGNYDLVGTFAHELNHVIANHTLTAHDSDSDTDNQEISGHVYAFATGINADLKSYFKATVPQLAVGTDVSKLDWSEFTADNNKNLTTSAQWQAHYDKLASVEYYIWKTYGKEICREIQYEFYNSPRPSVQSVLESKLGKDFNTILKEWYVFYQ
ncbi:MULTISPECIES: Ig-like domain-containing protein [Clostridium]|uniref:Ig-like domain-containing protein n=1 Tax=Clostridium frigoriphilum TaxID=443253 RepID=A0ABU7UKQ8_9CLOT|nr:Ig-like domain-containing protein [Clostridium sp. DSM 17811]MBU3097677.1 Ig-like domain-containing protein [Clostridium sp. DSM 17811]